MGNVRNVERGKVVWESLGSVGTMDGNSGTRKGEVGGTEKRVLGDLGKGKFEGRQEESGERWI